MNREIRQQMNREIKEEKVCIQSLTALIHISRDMHVQRQGRGAWIER